MEFVIIMTMIGIISLAGVVVNNAIVLIDYTNLLRARRREALGLEEGESAEDATGLDISPGDRVVLWGDAPRLEQVAAEAGTIPYELLTRIGPRVQRVIER